jgi:hypothetical protein
MPDQAVGAQQAEGDAISAAVEKALACIVLQMPAMQAFIVMKTSMSPGL